MNDSKHSANSHNNRTNKEENAESNQLFILTFDSP